MIDCLQKANISNRGINASKQFRKPGTATRVWGGYLALFLCCIVLGFGCRQLRAQLTVGGVVGTVKDPTGAVITDRNYLLT